MSISTRDADKGRPAKDAVHRLRVGGRGRGATVEKKVVGSVSLQEARKVDRRPEQ